MEILKGKSYVFLNGRRDMVETVEVNLNGVKMRAFKIKKLYTLKRRRKINGKIYEWKEKMVVFYVPKSLRDHDFLLIPVKKGEE